MGRLENSIFGQFKGRIGNLVSYQLKGKTITRTIGRSNKAPSLKQLSARQKMKVVGTFLKPLLAFINVGFEHAVAGTDRHPHNEASSYNIKHATTGEYPDIEIDYAKVMLSMGSLTPPANAAASLTGNELKITWDVEPDMSWGIKNDRAMLLIYCNPKKVIYLLSAARRVEGQDIIEVPDEYLGMPLHIYLAFKAADSKSVSNSVPLALTV